MRKGPWLACGEVREGKWSAGEELGTLLMATEFEVRFCLVLFSSKNKG